MSSSKLLLLKEFKELKARPKSNYFQVYGLRDDNIYEWIVFIIGPPKTRYSGGIYKAIMRFPKTYPMDPPSLQFVCSMYHPNVYSDGKVCISTLQVPSPSGEEGRDHAMYWRPVVGVEQALLSVISLLSDPNHEDPANSTAAAEWVNEPETFQQKLDKYKTQSKELVPEDFAMPIVLDPPHTIKDEQTNRDEDEEVDGDEDDTAFVYSSSEDEGEDTDGEEGENSSGSAKSDGIGAKRREGGTKGSDNDIVGESCKPVTQIDKFLNETENFIKSGVAEVVLPSQKRLKICK